MEPEHLFHSALTCPSSGNARHLKTRPILCPLHNHRSAVECGKVGEHYETPYFHPQPTLLQWPCQEQPGSGLTASAPVLDVSTPACTNCLCPPLRPVSVVQKNKPSTMLSSNVQFTDLPLDCTAWRSWMMRQLNGCSTSAPRSSAAKQFLKELAQTMKQLVAYYAGITIQTNLVVQFFVLKKVIVKTWVLFNHQLFLPNSPL